MSDLMAISVGPVQEFISAARRTSDLWYGSYLLSEISQAVVQKIASQNGKLIFRASSDAKRVANVILAELQGGDSRKVAAQAKEAAQKCWLKIAEEVCNEASGVIREEIWRDQVEDVIEFYAAWTPRTDHDQRDRACVMRLLAGRKNCRDFLAPKGYAGVPKSSLDSQRESVLKQPVTDWSKELRARACVREGEQLDVVGLVKRIKGGREPYPSVTRIAADPWVRGQAQRLCPLKDACETMANDDVIHKLEADKSPQCAAFPYEGIAVYSNRYHELVEEAGARDEHLEPFRLALKDLPEPYLAVLVADGDKMGATISQMDSLEAHVKLSGALEVCERGGRDRRQASRRIDLFKV